MYGYDIKLFNYYNEEEILLEPETKFIVDNVLPPIQWYNKYNLQSVKISFNIRL